MGLHPRRSAGADRRGPESLACRGARRRDVLPSLPPLASGPPRAAAVPRGSLPGDAGRGARGPRQPAARDRIPRDQRRWPLLARAGLLPGQLRLRPRTAARRCTAWPRHARAPGRAAGRAARPMSLTLYVPQDAAALSVGADAVARAIGAEASRRGIELQLRRNGSRGLL